MTNTISVTDFNLDQIVLGACSNWQLTFETAEDVEGTIPLRVVKGASAGPTLLILAAVHGDEYDGVQTVVELCNELTPEKINGTVLMVPITNKLSYEGISRETPLDGRNLAREFPGNPEGTYTQRLAWHLDQTLLAKADFLLDFHSGGMIASVPTLVGYYHNDKHEHGRRSRAAAEAFGVDTIWAHSTVGPGRTVSSATDRGIPWLYTETEGGRRVCIEGQQQYRKGTYRLLHHLDMLREPEAWLSEEACPAIKYRLYGDGNFDLSLTSKEEGFFIPSVKLLDEVKAGDLIGIIYGLFGEIKEKVISPQDGIMIGITVMPKVDKGGVICAITQDYDNVVSSEGKDLWKAIDLRNG
ncbi:succinylglutamate desuccinylase/aspartoacylase family protein [Paenibacillus sp. J5C_2022]|uniref:succinylglutamate desuccinylase/aspartoacylase family protein n=1 Tax=Paenibacillus sp. J5C2022 TaxID=2977129 RepID=UPI0021CE5849|nr:succinylglutamate desuccinylase/aspartoacylase family protein [Paenibacillus sp. J5C2022]MCU6709720.1 succinylglutamate desuccinylase/aspartoacylase family protein [Paenibacillus sp. J5C2022]